MAIFNSYVKLPEGTNHHYRFRTPHLRLPAHVGRFPKVDVSSPNHQLVAPAVQMVIFLGVQPIEKL